ncbi:MAG: hypothetical protein RH917_18065 [Lacipirellulaceae bacterium]
MSALTRTILAAAFLIASLPCSLRAQTNTWIGPPTGDWFDGANWSLGVAPSMFQDVRIDSDPAQNTAVSYGFPGPQQTSEVLTLTIDAGDSLSMASETELYLGSVNNSGTLSITGLEGTGPLGLRFFSLLHNQTGGIIEMQQGSISANLNFGGNNAGLLWNQGTIQGSGGIDENFDGISIRNNGLIDANRAGEVLAIHDPFNGFANPSGGTHSNGGIMQASGEGTLQLNNFSGSPLFNTDAGVAGTIQALGDSIVEIRNSRIVGGRITTSTAGGVEEGTIRLLESVSLAGVELDGNVIVGETNASTQTIISNSSLMNRRLLITARGESALISETVVLSGGGRLELSTGSAVQGVNFSFTTGKLINVDNTISPAISRTVDGAVSFGRNLEVLNQGIIEANGLSPQGDASLFLDFTPPQNHPEGQPAWKNSGVIRAINGGQITIPRGRGAEVDNAGGVIELGFGSRMNLGDVVIRGGTLRGPNVGPAPFNPGLLFEGLTTLDGVRLEGFVQADQIQLLGSIENTGNLSGPLGLIGNVVLGGSGVVSSSEIQRVQSSSADAQLINLDNTFSVVNDLSFSDVAFTNRGTVETTQPNSFGQISANTNGNRLTNSGVIRAIGGSNLQIFSTVDNYEFDQLGNLVPGKIQAGSGSQVEVDRVLGGTLQTAGDGSLRVNQDLNYDDSGQTPRFSESELKILGTVEFGGFNIAGVIRNEGLLTTNDNTRLQGGIVQFLGDGRLQLASRLTVEPGQTLINGSGHTIQGRVLMAGSTLLNQGRIESAEGSVAEISVTQTGIAHQFFQQGELIARNNSQFSITDVRNWSNQGLIKTELGSTMFIEVSEFLSNDGVLDVQADSTLRFDGLLGSSQQEVVVNQASSLAVIDGRMKFVDTDFINLLGARIDGSGLMMFLGNSSGLISHGIVSPGSNLPDRLVSSFGVFGNFTQSESGVLELQIGGNGFGEYDILTISMGGEVELAGALEVLFIDLSLGQGLFEPELGDSFDIIQYNPGSSGQIAGQFETLDLPELSDGLDWQIEYLPQVVSLNVIAAGALPADFNTDGTVDGWDLMEWQTAYGTSDAADANGDQSSNGLDFLAWQQQFTGDGPSSLATVPEPNTAILLACVFAVAAGPKFRQRG